MKKASFWNVVAACSACAFVAFSALFVQQLYEYFSLKNACVVEEPAPCTITIDGVIMSYVETDDTLDDKVGLWWGSDSTTDGSFGYYIGHDWTAFGVVTELENGDPVTIIDSNGDSLTYHVFDSFEVPDGTCRSEIEGRVEGHGESIAMQTCIENNHVRIVLAKAG